MVHGHPPRAEQAIGARKDRIQDHISGEGGRGPDIAGVAGHSGGVTVLYQWLQRAALQRETRDRRVDGGPHEHLTSRGDNSPKWTEIEFCNQPVYLL